MYTRSDIRRALRVREEEAGGPHAVAGYCLYNRLRRTSLVCLTPLTAAAPPINIWSALPERDEQAIAPHALRHRAVRLRVRVRVRVRLGLGLGSALGLGLGLGSALGLGFGFGLGLGLTLTLVYVPVPWKAPSCHWPG